MAKKKTRVDKMFRFCKTMGRYPREELFTDFTVEEIHQILQFTRGRNLHSLSTFINSFRVMSTEMTTEELKEVKDLFLVEKIHNS